MRIFYFCFIYVMFYLIYAPPLLHAQESHPISSPIVDTGQHTCYNNSGPIPAPQTGQPFYGQDAQYQGNPPSYHNNKDGTITDRQTQLQWSKAVDSQKISLIEAQRIARTMTLGGHKDWRVPTIKELYSLIDFRGYTGISPRHSQGQTPKNAIPFINTNYFDFKYGDTSKNERYIDAQWLSQTQYVSTTMQGSATLFGVNFADGRIKGYGYKHPKRSQEKKFFARYVRGPVYGKNAFIAHNNGTIIDQKTGLMWTQHDSQKAMTWKQALYYAETLTYAGHDDWRLPNAKELQYIVDYTRSPDTTNSAAIDPIFQTTMIKNEAGQSDYPYFWTSTTHLDGPQPGNYAVYISFGRAIGEMHGTIMDVHGAGAQRSDPKIGSPDVGHGPQGDARRIYNFVRCVRGGAVTPISTQHPFIHRLDRNNDRKISRSEFDGPSHGFHYLDTNKDGYISQDEAPKKRPPKHARYL